MRDVLKMPPGQDLTLCNTQSNVRKQWFQYFAHTYGVDGGGLPTDTCFIDLPGQAGVSPKRDATPHTNNDSLCLTAVDFVATPTTQVQSRLSLPPLEPKEREKFRQQVEEALQQKPADTFPTCWLPDALNRVLPYAMSSKIGACAKRAYILTKYPEFHVSASLLVRHSTASNILDAVGLFVPPIVCSDSEFQRDFHLSMEEGGRGGGG
jgi:hypothetical protein